MPLIPSRILNGADFIRRLRNDFVHEFSIDTFGKLEPSRLQSMRDRLLAFDRKVPEKDARVFRLLALWNIVALYVYTIHVSSLNDLIRSPKFLVSLQTFIERIRILGRTALSGLHLLLARLLMAAYKRRLRGIVAAAPTWVSEEILSASEHIGDDRVVLWITKN